jgi:hypothetical protein
MRCCSRSTPLPPGHAYLCRPQDFGYDVETKVNVLPLAIRSTAAIGLLILPVVWHATRGRVGKAGSDFDGLPASPILPG